jgi:hypothetical protein
MVWRREDYRSRHEIFRWRTGEILGAGLAFCYRDVTGGPDELRKLLVGHVGFVHPEGINIYAMDWA